MYAAFAFDESYTFLTQKFTGPLDQRPLRARARHHRCRDNRRDYMTAMSKLHDISTGT